MHAEGWNIFTQLCLTAKDEGNLTSILELFLTAEEKENVALRSAIVMELLKKEKTQRQIAESLHVSIAKITRGSNELKRMPGKLIEFLREFYNRF
jgi:TrpR family trp operon transcriptional repressor